MSYRDINNVADWSCIRCDKPLDRIGSHCKSCMIELQEEIDHLEAEHREKKMNKIDEKQLGDMRDLIVKLLRAYGVTADLDGFDNKALKVELEKVMNWVAR